MTMPLTTTTEIIAVGLALPFFVLSSEAFQSSFLITDPYPTKWKRKTLKSLQALPEQNEECQLGAWIPVGSASSLKGLSPTNIVIMNENFVVWNNHDQWSVMVDVCPHRLAPLSQGRINEKTGCVECGYHGWQFRNDGSVSVIPQLEPDKDISKFDAASVTSYPVHLTGDLIWAFLPTAIHGESFPKDILPEDYYPGIKTDMERKAAYYVHEMPFSMHMLIENGIDPAHFAFAHCGVIAKREDAAPIPDMKVEILNFTNLDVYSTYKRNGESRERQYCFQRPCLLYTKERSRDEKNMPSWTPGSLFFVVPIREGRCRVITSVAKLTKSYVPDWITHLATRRLFQGDYFVHEAELNLRSQKRLSYVQPTTSDIGTRAWNKWMEKFGFYNAPPHTFGIASTENLIPLTLQERIDPWRVHTKTCSKCRKVLARAKKTQLWSLIVGIFGASLLQGKKRSILAGLTICAGIILSRLAKKVSILLEGSNNPSDVPDRDYSMTVK